MPLTLDELSNRLIATKLFSPTDIAPLLRSLETADHTPRDAAAAPAAPVGLRGDIQVSARTFGSIGDGLRAAVVPGRKKQYVGRLEDSQHDVVWNSLVNLH